MVHASFVVHRCNLKAWQSKFTRSKWKTRARNNLVRFPIFPNFETRSFLSSIHVQYSKTNNVQGGKFDEAQLREDQIYFNVDGILDSLPQLRHSWPTVHISAHCVPLRQETHLFLDHRFGRCLFLCPVVSNYGKMRARRENWRIRFARK